MTDDWQWVAIRRIADHASDTSGPTHWGYRVNGNWETLCGAITTYRADRWIETVPTRPTCQRCTRIKARRGLANLILLRDEHEKSLQRAVHASFNSGAIPELKLALKEDRVNDERLKSFRRQQVSSEELAAIRYMTEEFERVAQRILGIVTPSRELDMALTRLQEAKFWANEGIAQGHLAAREK
jgi:hypothetical protein